MASRGQSLVVAYVAWDTSTNAGKTGDAGNHTLRWIKDGASAAPAGSPAEVDAQNAPGVYKITLSAAECNCNAGVLAGKSSTPAVVIIPLAVTFERLPTAAPGSAGGLPTVDADNQVAGLGSTGRNAVADAVLARDMDQVESAAPEHSLCTVVLAVLESSLSGTAWTIKRTDGSTPHAVKTVTTDAAAQPITGVS